MVSIGERTGEIFQINTNYRIIYEPVPIVGGKGNIKLAHVPPLNLAIGGFINMVLLESCVFSHFHCIFIELIELSMNFIIVKHKLCIRSAMPSRSSSIYNFEI